MMNRYAELLFWAGRYMERAENHARLIEVNYHMRHELRSTTNDHDYAWEKLVAAVGDTASFKAGHAIANERTVLHFLTFDHVNPNSLYTMIHQTRSNIRTLRQLLPGDLWEIINAFYLWLGQQNMNKVMQQSPYAFFQRVRESISLFNGAADSAMSRSWEWHFLQAGKFLERAAGTSRVLHHAALNYAKDNVSLQDLNRYSQIIVLLKSVGAQEAFRRSQASDVTFAKAIPFLLLHEGFPRSVQFALTQLEAALTSLQNMLDEPAALTGLIREQLNNNYSFLADLDDNPQHAAVLSDFLCELVGSCNELGTRFASVFFQESHIGA